jgi:hypothetical protein
LLLLVLLYVQLLLLPGQLLLLYLQLLTLPGQALLFHSMLLRLHFCLSPLCRFAPLLILP